MHCQGINLIIRGVSEFGPVTREKRPPQSVTRAYSAVVTVEPEGNSIRP